MPGRVHIFEKLESLQEHMPHSTQAYLAGPSPVLGALPCWGHSPALLVLVHSGRWIVEVSVLFSLALLSSPKKLPKLSGWRRDKEFSASGNSRCEKRGTASEKDSEKTWSASCLMPWPWLLQEILQEQHQTGRVKPVPTAPQAPPAPHV